MVVSNPKRCGPRSAHSQIVRWRQPAFSVRLSTARSRRRLPLSFFFQNATRVPGCWNRPQSWPCQKQPCTWIAAPYLGSIRSGRPGTLPDCSLKRNPNRCSPLRIKRSGLVSRDRMPDIIRLRVFRSTTSGNFPLLATHEQIRLNHAFTRNPGQHVRCNSLDHGDDHRVPELFVGLRI